MALSHGEQFDDASATFAAMGRVYRLMAGNTARVMEEIADGRRDHARLCDTLADCASGSRAARLRVQAHDLRALAERAEEFAERERRVADGAS